MKKIKYYYNTRTLRYEKLEIPFRIKLLRVLGFIATALVTSALIVAIAFANIDSPKEKFLKQRNDTLQQNYNIKLKNIIKVTINISPAVANTFTNVKFKT